MEDFLGPSLEAGTITGTRIFLLSRIISNFKSGNFFHQETVSGFGTSIGDLDATQNLVLLKKMLGLRRFYSKVI